MGKRAKIVFCVVFTVLSIVAMFDFSPAPQTSSTLEHVTTKESGWTRTDYVDSAGVLTTATDLGYASVVKDLDESGQAVLERYYDEQGEPTTAKAGQFAVSYVWSGTSYVEITFLDEAGAPMANSSGYATRVREYNDAHKVEREYYQDVDGAPCTDSAGEYGRTFEYDADGHTTKVTSVDADGTPMMNKSGYCYVERTYYDDGTLDTERYYDTAGQPARLSGGQYAVKHSDGRTIYLGEHDEELFRPYNLFSSCPWLVVVIGAALAVIAARLPRRGQVVFLVLYVAFILFETLLRTPGTAQVAHGPFSSYVLFFSNYSTRVEIVENIWLFVPFGAALLGLVGRRRWLAVAIPLAFSVGIECVQYLCALGTLEVDDMIDNTLGGVVGAVIASCAREGSRASINRP